MDLNLNNKSLAPIVEKICSKYKSDHIATEVILSNIIFSRKASTAISDGAARYQYTSPVAVRKSLRRLAGLVSSAGYFASTYNLTNALASQKLDESLIPEPILFRKPKKEWDSERDAINLDYTDTPEIISMREELLEYNSFTSKHVVEFKGTRCSTSLRRIFNNCSDKSDLIYGGRLYGTKGSYQALSGDERKQILIDNEPVCELDYGEIHPRILLLGLGKVMSLDSDLYSGYDNRSQVKLALNVMLNAKSTKTAAKALVNDPIFRGSYATVHKVMGFINSKYPELEQYLCSGVGLKLQRTDSDIAMSVIKQCVNQNSVVLLCVHDSFVCKVCDREILRGAMIKAYQEILNTDSFPKIKE